MNPPFLARTLLAALAGAAEAECVAGDLQEEFTMLRESRGASAAARWYFSQAIRSAWPLLQLRIRSGELTQVTLLAVFGIAGPLLALDRLWQFVYSRIPFKDGLHRAPQLLAINALAVCASALVIGACSGGSDGRPSKSRAAAMALAAACAAIAAVWLSVGAAPALYSLGIVLAAPTATLLSFAARRSK